MLTTSTSCPLNFNRECRQNKSGLTLGIKRSRLRILDFPNNLRGMERQKDMSLTMLYCCLNLKLQQRGKSCNWHTTANKKYRLGCSRTLVTLVVKFKGISNQLKLVDNLFLHTATKLKGAIVALPSLFSLINF